MALGYALSITKSRPHLAPLETRNPALAGSSRRETKFQSALTQSASKACARTLSITFGSASPAKPLGASLAIVNVNDDVSVGHVGSKAWLSIREGCLASQKHSIQQ